jgi:peptide/nickel transport system substrate-binding protein
MSNISRREFVKLSAAAIAGTILTACAPTVSNPIATPPTAEAEPTTAPEPTATEAVAAEATATTEPTKAPEPTAAPARTWPLGDVPRNQTLIYSYQSAPAAGNFSPLAAGYNHQVGSALLYEPAAYYGAHADKMYMWLAESYKYNEDATEFDITFRKGITWSDGTPFTAEDPAYFMKFLAANGGFRGSGTYAQELADAVAVDDLNLKVTLKQPDFRFFFKSLTFRFDLGDDTVMLPMHIFKDVPVEEMTSYLTYDVEKGWPVSSGPYGVSQSNEQLTYYDLRPTWWAVETGFVEKYPEVVRLQMTLYNNDQVGAQLLLNNETDCPFVFPPLLLTSVLAQAPDHVTTWSGNQPPFGYTDWWPLSVQFCTAKPPFDNPKVRWAVSYAIDRQKLVDVAWAGAGKPTNAPFPEFKKLDEYMAGIKDLTDQYNVLEFSLEKSAALMTEAGFTKNADGFWADKNGVVPDSDLYAAVPLFADLAPVLAEMLNSAGFASQHKAPNDVWAAKVDGRASMFLFGHGGATIDPYDTFQLYRKSGVLPMGEQSWGNITRWWNDETERLAEEVNKTAMDDPAMKDLFKAWMTEYYVNLPDAPITQFYHRIPLNTTYWTNWPDQNNPYMNQALWHLTASIVVYGVKATGAA